MSLVQLREPVWNKKLYVPNNCEDRKYEVNVNVAPFKPEEISIKVNEKNVLLIEGKHEEKEDEQVISKHSVRKILLPEGLDVGKIRAKLYPDGILIISLPKVEQGVKSEHVKNIPVQRVKSKL